MYLYDQISQARRPTVIEDARGGRHRVPGPAEAAAAVGACGVRYVLDDAIRDTCLELLCNRAAVIRLDDPCYRIPHQSMWVEWVDPVPGRGGARQRAGLLVEADETGRRGTMQSFSHDPADGAWAGQVFFAFDFDTVLADEPALCGLAFANVSDADEVARIFRHCMGHIDRSWLGYFRGSGGLAPGELQALVRASAPDFGLLCAFLLLLGLDCSVARPREGLARINRARARSGKALLLDHLEVGLRLAVVGEGGAGAGGDRGAPRLHQVRGHVVRRGGKTFWRTHHLRGDVGKGVVASRTVRVSGDATDLRRRVG